MRKVLAAWNKFQNSIEFHPRVDLDLVHFEVSRTFAFTGLGTCDFKLDVLKKLIKQFKALLWTYGGTWSIGIASNEYDVTLVAKCAAVCPPISKNKYKKIHDFVLGANYTCALAGEDMVITVYKQQTHYDKIEIEKLFAKTLNTGVWPTSFMVNCTSPISTLFAAHLELQLRGQKTIGTFGPCTTVRKRLQHDCLIKQ